MILPVVLDPCCGSKMFWFDGNNQRVLFGDIRDEDHVLCDGRALSIKPDVMVDFRKMDFPDGSFKLVVFDPPHLRKAGCAPSTEYYRMTGNPTCVRASLNASACWPPMACLFSNGTNAKSR